MSPKRQVLGLASRAERQRARVRLGALSTNVIAPATLARYRRHGRQFFFWVAAQRDPLPPSPVEFDMLICRYIDECWTEGEARSHVGDVLSCLQHLVPPLRGKLAASWRLHAAWGKLELPCRAWPLTKLQVLAVAGAAWQQQLFDVAIACLVGFHGVFRTGELLAMQWGHLQFHATSCTVTLPHSKSGLAKASSRWSPSMTRCSRSCSAAALQAPRRGNS